MGRKPDARAIRRKDDHAAITPETVLEGELQVVDKPMDIAANPNLSAMWDLMVGGGIAYKPSDAPLLAQLVFELETARQLRAACVDENGMIRSMVGKGQPNEDGEYLDYVPNPQIKLLRESTQAALKLADQLGMTPLARARLGLTQAAGKAVTLSIAEQIDAAMRRAAR